MIKKFSHTSFPVIRIQLANEEIAYCFVERSSRFEFDIHQLSGFVWTSTQTLLNFSNPGLKKINSPRHTKDPHDLLKFTALRVTSATIQPWTTLRDMTGETVRVNHIM